MAWPFWVAFLVILISPLITKFIYTIIKLQKTLSDLIEISNQ